LFVESIWTCRCSSMNNFRELDMELMLFVHEILQQIQCDVALRGRKPSANTVAVPVHSRNAPRSSVAKHLVLPRETDNRRCSTTAYEIQVSFRRAGIVTVAAVETGRPICQRDAASPEPGTRPGITRKLPNRGYTADRRSHFLTLLFDLSGDRSHLSDRVQ
jgi:hypothetical protein